MDSNRVMHDFLATDCYPYNRKIMKACGLTSLPDRRTFDRRLAKIFVDIKERIAAIELWIFGYKLHITASTDSLIIPLSADFTQADVQDNQIYPTITCSSSLPQGVRYMAADSGNDDHKLHNLSIDRGFELVCPVSEIYNNTSSDRLQLIEFYESKTGQPIYSWRSISVEQLKEHIKDVLKIDSLPIRGY
ncbi:MAG: transposase [Nitrososphaeraceae archaeon]